MIDDITLPKRQDSTENIKTNLEKLTVDFKTAQQENIDLKKQIKDANSLIKDKGKQSELWKTMYDRVSGYLPNNELDIIKESFDREKLNLLDTNRELFIDEEAYKSKLNSIVTKLNEENLSLKMKLERLQDSNKTELEILKKYQNENKRIKSEVNSLKEKHLNEIKQREVEIENLKIKLKHEQQERDELKKRHSQEINAANIRYENELSIQNNLMKKKYDDLIKEINQLHESIRRLQKEKHILIERLKSNEEKLFGVKKENKCSSSSIKTSRSSQSK